MIIIKAIMAIPAALVVVPIGMLFILSGLIVNSIQVLQNGPFVYNFAFPCNFFFLILNFITKICLPFGVWNLKLQELRLSNFGYNEKMVPFICDIRLFFSSLFVQHRSVSIDGSTK